MAAQVLINRRRGPLRVVVETEGMALEVLSRAERNRSMREALANGGRVWPAVFLPLRFTDYARRLGYRKTKEPFVVTGQMRDTAIAGTRVQGIAQGSRLQIVIRVPYGHPLLARYSDVFRSLPPWEVQRIAIEVGAWLRGIRTQVVRTGVRKGIARYRRAEGPVQPVRAAPRAIVRAAAHQPRRAA